MKGGVQAGIAERQAEVALNVDEQTVASFGNEWAKFDQSALPDDEHRRMFDAYFGIFSWEELPANAEGFDMGCGSGRWAKLVAPRVGVLNCIDPAAAALDVARRNLAGLPGARFHHATVDTAPLAPGSQDFGYSLGVLHHIPDAEEALMTCVRYLKPGAPFLLYLYYAFDNRPAWFRMLWSATERVRGFISSRDDRTKAILTDPIALLVYLPLAKIAWAGTRLGFNMQNFPLYGYREASLYTMRTDSRDRFGTPLEQRFSRSVIDAMMRRAGLVDIRFSDREPFWCAIGRKAGSR